ncbi:serine-rich adhesin for platelets [Octopus sinensis]|uniref:Serine-rich adhesin for platelets n=1 Tax=Octopus sinensis TaxID=2607531 RepID=A0A7E6FJV9_9MOLL|nr:serine-rich adhesin for platelets [Octopus sinensis]
MTKGTCSLNSPAFILSTTPKQSPISHLNKPLSGITVASDCDSLARSSEDQIGTLIDLSVTNKNIDLKSQQLQDNLLNNTDDLLNFNSVNSATGDHKNTLLPFEDNAPQRQDVSVTLTGDVSGSYKCESPSLGKYLVDMGKNGIVLKDKILAFICIMNHQNIPEKTWFQEVATLILVIQKGCCLNSFNGIKVPGNRTKVPEGQLSYPLPLSADTNCNNSTQDADIHSNRNILQTVSLEPRPALPPLTSSSEGQFQLLSPNCDTCGDNYSSHSQSDNRSGNHIAGERSISKTRNLPICAQQKTVDSGSSASSSLDVGGGKGGGNDCAGNDSCIHCDIRGTDSNTLPSCTGTDSHLSEKTTINDNRIDVYKTLAGTRVSTTTTPNTIIDTTPPTLPTITFSSAVAATSIDSSTVATTTLTSSAAATTTTTANVSERTEASPSPNTTALTSIYYPHNNASDHGVGDAANGRTTPITSADYLWHHLEQLMSHRNNQVVKLLFSYGIDSSPIPTSGRTTEHSKENHIWKRIEEHVPTL